jgi:magnesium chelatase family protein
LTPTPPDHLGQKREYALASLLIAWIFIGMLAQRLRRYPPAMSLAEALETTRIHRVAGLTGAGTALVTARPCRAPPQTIWDVGLIGGGHIPMPGEVSLAHHGILFLDELPEFRRHVLEVLRQPLEEGVTYI